MRKSGVIFGASLALLTVTFAIYAGRLDGPFLFDDEEGIVKNASIRALLTALAPPENSPLAARPIPNLSLAFDFARAGLDPGPYHRSNLVLHGLNVLLAFALVSGLLARGRFPQPVREHATTLAFAAALLFAVHPVVVEPVLYTVQRTELCVSFFFLATAWAVVWSHTARRPLLAYAVAWIACLAGMASKAVMAPAPLLLLFLDRAFLAGSFREALRRRLLLHVGLALGLVLLLVLEAGDPRGGSVEPPSLRYFAAQSEIVPAYLGMAFLSRGHVLDFGMLRQDTVYGSWASYLGVGGLVLGCLILAFTHPRLGFVGAWVFGILAPSSSFVTMSTEVGAERRIYLPLVAILVVTVLAVSAAGRRLPKRARVALGSSLLALAAVALGLQSRARTAAFADERTFWQSAAAERPQNPRAHYNLGEALRKQGELEGAAGAYAAAVLAYPRYQKARVNLGGALTQLRRWDEAEEQLEAAVELQPHDFTAHYNLATVLTLKGKLPEAVTHLERAVSIDPAHERARARLAQLRQLTGSTPPS